MTACELLEGHSTGTVLQLRVIGTLRDAARVILDGAEVERGVHHSAAARPLRSARSKRIHGAAPHFDRVLRQMPAHRGSAWRRGQRPPIMIVIRLEIIGVDEVGDGKREHRRSRGIGPDLVHLGIRSKFQQNRVSVGIVILIVVHLQSGHKHTNNEAMTCSNMLRPTKHSLFFQENTF